MQVSRARLYGLLLGCVLLAGGTASAQPAPAPSDRASNTTDWARLRPKGDVGGSLGWFNGKTGTVACCQWYASLWSGIEGGYYWTEHIRTEAGFAGTHAGDVYADLGPVVIDGRPYWSSGYDRVSTRRLWAAQLYQFRHNAWVHPFAGAGVTFVTERRDGTRYRYPTSGPGPSVEERLPQQTRTQAMGLALAGLKIYASRRAFFRTDLMIGFREAWEEATVRFGFGVDF
jgi:hypothetical protein